MKNCLTSLMLLLAALAGGGICFAQKSPLADSRQMLVVTTPDWTSVQGRLERFEFENGKWRRVGETTEIVVGKNGLAWGDGLHPKSTVRANRPIKREGDGKSPAGAFRLTSIFGVSGDGAKFKLPFTQLVESTECVDDVKSSKYNSIVDRSKVGNFDWKSSEKMLEVGEQYAWGIFVAHNSAPVTRGNGSCIFLHIWKDAASGTAGCTAMERARLETILEWLDAEKNPVLVQLPQSEYRRVRADWKLPKNN